MKLEFKRLGEIDCLDYIALNTHPLVRRQMPLTSDTFDEEDCRQWIAGKEKMWAEHGYGPWAFVVDGRFVGWGGLQPEEGDVDLGLVLHPDFWGYGKMIYESVTILFPPTRTRIKGILRLGFEPDGEVEIGGEKFIRYRLYAPQTRARSSE
jgi:[ribosomal protein S5]-alanine N-acetyltransferase